MNLAFKIHSIIGLFLALFFFYLSFTWYFMLLSLLFLTWSTLACFFNDLAVSRIIIKYVSYLVGSISSIAFILTLFFIFSTSSPFISNILLSLALLLGFLISWSLFTILYLKKNVFKK